MNELIETFVLMNGRETKVFIDQGIHRTRIIYQCQLITLDTSPVIKLIRVSPGNYRIYGFEDGRRYRALLGPLCLAINEFRRNRNLTL